ncbi:transposase, partial [Candidatus Sumerlaeota bacterium]
MRKERRNFTAAQKAAVLREHLLDKIPASELCEKHNLQPTVFYR